MVTLLSVFSVACNLDSEKSSATGHNLPVLLLLSRHWVLAVAVLLPHLMKNSVPIHWKNIQATQVKCSRNDNCDKLESRKPISKQRKRQKAPGFQRFCLSVAVPDKRWNQNESNAILQTFLFLNCCKTISCYFMLFYQRAPYLYRGLAFQVLQLLSMLFSSSSRWGILCLPAKRSFEKSGNIVSRETSNWHELTFNTIWFDCLSNCLSLVHKCTANITCRTTVRHRFKQVCGGPPQLQQACLWAAAPHQKTPLCTILAYISNSPFQMVTLRSVFSVACNLDSEKSSATGHNLPVLLLLSRHWVLAVAVLLPHLMKNSVPIHWKNIQATQVKCSRNDNCDKLESRKPISKQRKRQKAPGFQRFCLSVAVPDKRWNQNESNAILHTFLFINCCKTISCYFMLFYQGAPYLYRGLAFQVLQLLSMLFSSSSRWGILCLPWKRSFEKSWNIVSCETSNWHELTFNTIWLSFQLLEFGA